MIDVKEVLDDRTGETTLEVPLRGRPLLDCSLLNKGSAFSEQERRDFGLVGLLPCCVSTLEEQADRRYLEYRRKATDLERFLFLRDLQDRNETLFFRLLQDHLAEMPPIIYTPEVGEVCQRYSHIYHRPRGLFLAYPQRHELDAIPDRLPWGRDQAPACPRRSVFAVGRMQPAGLLRTRPTGVVSSRHEHEPARQQVCPHRRTTEGR